MGWAVGYDSNWGRDIGYGVPAICDHPECVTTIDRGLAYVCGADPFGGDEGCGLFFCPEHLGGNEGCSQLCERCLEGQIPFDAKPDIGMWIQHKLTDGGWSQWREENPEEVARLSACS